MGRRTSSGRIGAPTFGGLLAAENTTITTDSDADIIIDPTGTGRVLIAGTLQIQDADELRFADADGSNYVAFKSSATVGSNVTWTLPNTDGSSGQFLSTDGNGALSFATGAVAVNDETTDSGTYYLTFTDSTSGNLTVIDINTTTDALEYVPSTGTLTVTALSAGSITETSSLTLKENFNPIQDALDKIMCLDTYIYDRKDGSAQEEAGLIAEEVDSILPNLVKKDANGNPQGIMYTKLSVYLIEAVKTLKQEIDSLKGKL